MIIRPIGQLRLVKSKRICEMSVKILALCGSPRKDKSRTAWLVRRTLDAAQKHGAKTEFIDVTRLQLGPCLACDRCHHLGECVQKDDFNGTFRSMLSADGIVLGSPVYIYHVTAQLKMFIDRLANAIHCSRLDGKYGAVIATAGGAGQEETASYMEQLLARLGAQCVGKVACTLEDGPVEPGSAPALEAAELGLSLVEAIRAKKVFADQVREMESRRGYFRELMVKRQEHWPWEYRYWREKGWL